MGAPQAVALPQQTAQQPAAATRELVKVYGSGEAAVRALDGVSVQFGRAQFTAIMGASGSGKSTLMHCMAGLDSATSGQVWIGTTELTRLRDAQLTKVRRDQIGFVFQAYNLLPQLTAEENILLPLQLAGRRPEAGLFEHLIEVLGLRSRLKHRPSQLSGGQQQRVAVARALVTAPALVLADEPTGNLDSQSTADMLAVLDRLNRSGRTIVLITHEPDVAEHARRLIRLVDGQVVQDIRQAPLYPTAETVNA